MKPEIGSMWRTKREFLLFPTKNSFENYLETKLHSRMMLVKVDETHSPGLVRFWVLYRGSLHFFVNQVYFFYECLERVTDAS